MNPTKFLPLLFLSIMCFTKSNAQEIDSMMNVYAEQLPQQKVHVHFDKAIYRAGETLWFKAYIFSGFTPAVNSKNFYAELIDNNGSVIQQKVYPVVESSAAGSFDLPLNLSGNTYRFRAYTIWMLNFDTSFIYKKDIIISGTKGDVKSNVANVVKAPATLTFFPEGGDMVSGLESVVAFKANDSYGLPESITGKVVNLKGETVVDFKSAHNGMGTFSLTPSAGEAYTAKWKATGGTEQTTPLPSARPGGVVLQVMSSGDKKVFSVARSDDGNDKLKRLRIVAQIGQQIVYKARVPMEGTKNGGAIPTKDFPAGIMTITAFTENYEPLAERIVMVNNRNHLLKASLTSTATDLNKRGKNSLEITVPDTNLTNLSISVTDAGLSDNSTTGNIISGLLMTGDLKGYVHKPAYYFLDTSDSTAKHLDLVMLTNGWRRYKWEDLVQRRKPILKFPLEPSLSINAKVFGVTNYSPLSSGEQITAIVETKDSSKYVFVLDKTGKETFSAGGVTFYDTAKIYYQFVKNKSNSSSLSVAFDNGLHKVPKTITLDTLPTTFNWYDSTLVARNKDVANEVIKYVSSLSTATHVLGPVVVKTRVKSRAEQLDEQYTSGLFRGQDAFSFDLINDVFADGAFNIFAYLQGKVAGLTVNNALSGTPSVLWRGSQTALFLDEMPVEAEMLSAISPSQVAYIKVFRPPFFGAMGGGAGGAIAVYTRKGGDVPATLSRTGLARNTIVGYSPPKEFYSPDYSNKELSDNTESDYRSTLYWNPFLFFDANKQKVKIDFYNNDFSKSYKVIIEGVNDVGKMIRIEKLVQ